MTTVQSNQPIGVIDSGVGGLTVVKECLKQLPNETIYYLGDSKRCPYGTRTKEEVIQFTNEMADFLLTKNIKLLVVACNTATAFALTTLKQRLSIPVIGVIESGSLAAIHATHSQRIGVIATQGTIKSNIYQKTLENYRYKGDIFGLACPDFVTLVEKNQADTKKTQDIVTQTLTNLKQNNIDTLILGCTHYPLLKNAIQNAMGENVELIDSGAQTIFAIKNLLQEQNMFNMNDSPIMHRFFTTGETEMFTFLATKWLEKKDIVVERINLI